MKKKITQLRWLVTTFLLVAAMVVPTQAWADIEPSKPSGEGTSTSPYQISTAAELYWFAGLVNGDEKVCTGDVNRNLSACATLTADITVNSGVLKADGTLADDTSSFTEWKPMGDPPNQPYNGTFEGANHTISGLYFNNSTTNHVGLFGGICGTVMNVGVIDSYFKGQSCVGGVCGMIKNYGTITNCYNKGAVSGDREVGGVCGWMYSSSTITKSTITDCYNTGKVSGKEYVGGVCGSIAVYDSETATVTNCYNTGSVSGTSAVGGVCGINGAFFSNSTATVNKCYNTGAVSGSNEVGGVCGRNTTSPSYSTATVINCYNIGAVSGYSEVGGVCGNSAPVYDPGQNNAYTYIKNCYNIGTVSGTSSVGGVCGSALFDFQPGTSYYFKIENCYYNTDIYSGYAVGNIVEGGTVCTKVEGKTSAKFRSGEVAYLLFYGNNDGVWGQAIGTESYPVLGGQTVYQFTPTCSSGSENKAYSNTYYQNNIPDHYYINGICSACGGYQPAQKNEEGYYEIDNAGQLFWFAGLVNGDEKVCTDDVTQNAGACATLTANITVNSGVLKADGTLADGASCFIQWTPIGNYDNQYSGTFNGHGKSISGLYFNNSETSYVGLFGSTNQGTIQNVGVVDSYFNGGEYVGGMCGQNKGTITNCYYAGSVNGTSNVGNICGILDSEGIITYCYYLANKDDGNGGKTSDQFANGEVAWLLNGGSVDGTTSATTDGTQAWYQTLSDDGDAWPVGTNTGTNTVYQVEYYSCDGKTNLGKTYSNTNETVVKPHELIGENILNEVNHFYTNTCQTEDKTVYFIDAAGTIEAIPNDGATVFTVASLTLEDATKYDNQCVFTVTDFTYTRTLPHEGENGQMPWAAWYVPFELELTDDICAKYDFSRINNVHQYDDNDDGTVDRTVIESFRQRSGKTLHANSPYLVRAKSMDYKDMKLELKDIVPALSDENSIDCQSVDYTYTFKGTYSELANSNTLSNNPYALWEDGEWYHFASLSPMRHYLTIESRTTNQASGASLKCIKLCVIGEEDVTGVVNIYSDERKATETYDLGGRRLPEGSQQSGLLIKNGKVIFNKQK